MIKKIFLKLKYGIGYCLATVREYFWLQVLRLLAVLDKSGEARKQYNIARYKFHHL